MIWEGAKDGLNLKISAILLTCSIIWFIAILEGV
jgi:hypothetical protein